MARCAALASIFLFCSMTLAADVYTVPPHPKSDATKLCAINFDAGQPTTGAAKVGWNVSATGKYNYDNSRSFKSIDVTLVYINTKTGATKQGPSYSVTNEASLAVPGSWSASFTNITAPGMDEQVKMYATIFVTNPNTMTTSSYQTPGGATVLPPP